MRMLVGLAFLLTMGSSIAETVFVKYRGPVDLAPFACETIKTSSLVNRICYDNQNGYLLVSLKAPTTTTAELTQARSRNGLAHHRRGASITPT